MRMSCNGCRVLRKGCSNGCTIRPCLQWIKSPDSQAHATLFLAKFYGRAGLLNLINAGPQHLRPAIFKSLLYEACGRIVDPIYGSLGLLWSGNWSKCQSAVDAVLSGSPITSTQDPAPDPTVPLNACDIRHVARDSTNLNQVKNRIRFKRNGLNEANSGRFGSHGLVRVGRDELSDLTSHDSLEDSMFSVEAVDASFERRTKSESGLERNESRAGEVGLELTLGLA
ncbi:hypothetical protein FNV43_RR26602 [Rhamnella rubrinervis]|uniref:LOB domain-containing protein n=1 Tax=Rhamnella rubrinervis TaxID=2594499 RepID=A0A8K0DNB1_9ROSA|nr:hypothetical protein FNV43_RR26602 [Rhamnella rubrinervis]